MDGSELSIDISRSYHIIALSNSNSLSIYKTFITLEFILAEKLKLHGEYQQLATLWVMGLEIFVTAVLVAGRGPLLGRA